MRSKYRQGVIRKTTIVVIVTHTDISLAELAEVLRTLGSTSADDVKRTMAEIDTDGDGNIDFKEFGAFCRANPGLMKDVAKVFL